jgi:N-acetylmuramoyl-L-alanine amidase
MTQSALAIADDARSPRPRARRLATNTGATLALAALAVGTSSSIAHADEEYTVRKGDTVSHIAKQFGTTVSAVRTANGLNASGFIREGQTLTIPTTGTTTGTAAATPAATGSHTVAQGETVSAIAARYGSTVDAIVSANGLDARAFIRAGQTLTIPGAGTPAATTTGTSTGGSHTVAQGETVSAIAARYGTTVSAVVSANGLNAQAFIRAGQTLTIPGATTTTAAVTTTSASGEQLVGSTFLGRTYPAATVASANENKATLLAIGVPSTSQMQDKVASTARQMGVDPSLAQAIAFQESGFDHTSVSPANAIGVMQVIPTSGDWASDLVGRELNLLDPDDNVVAGVAIIRQLLKSTGGDTATAIAGYYQGLGSVRSNGMFADTRRYVANVQTLTARF